MIASNNQPRFDLGLVVATLKVLTTLEESGNSASKYLKRHHCGDWGDVSAEDARGNEEALRNGERIFSVYRIEKNRKIYVITESDRSSTCILLPEGC